MSGRERWESALALAMVLFSGLLMLSASAVTDQEDVEALKVLYAALNSPPQLIGWKFEGGDPCSNHSWLGVYCTNDSITAIHIGGLGINGSLGSQLSRFKSLLELDVSNNNIGGEIPYDLPKNANLINFASNHLTKNIPFSFPTLKFLRRLNISHNNLSGPIGNVFTGLQHLTEMDLSYNNFSGDLPSSFNMLTHLEGLYLQGNQFTGSVILLAHLPLSILNLENNHFSGILPKQFKYIGRLRIDGNMFHLEFAFPPQHDSDSIPYTTQPLRNVPTDQNVISDPLVESSAADNSSSHAISNNKKRMSKRGIAGILSSVIFVAIFAPVVLMHMYKSQRSKFLRSKSRGGPSYVLPITASKNSEELDCISKEAPTMLIQGFPSARRIKPERMSRRKSCSRRSRSLQSARLYSALDLQIATNGFAEENIIGEGSLGLVYKAEFSDGQVFAVKKIDMVGLGIREEDEFLDVICNMSCIRHPNILSLRGYCVEQRQHAVVYDYARNGSLDDALHFRNDQKALPWKMRIKIALGVARALEHLHWACSPRVAHDNLKSSNILLDNEYMPRLGDFGLTMLWPLVSNKKDSVFPFGCTGYTAPEFGRTGTDKTRSDIFSFGVVLLELLTGRKAFDSSRPEAERSLVQWSSSRLHDFGLLEQFIDLTIKGTFSSKALSQFADIILLCIQPQPEFRPPITEIADMLVCLIQSMNYDPKGESDDAEQDQFDTVSFTTSYSHFGLSSPLSC